VRLARVVLGVEVEPVLAHHALGSSVVLAGPCNSSKTVVAGALLVSTADRFRCGRFRNLRHLAVIVAVYLVLFAGPVKKPEVLVAGRAHSLAVGGQALPVAGTPLSHVHCFSLPHTASLFGVPAFVCV